MQLIVSQSWVQMTLFVAARLTGATMFAPVFGPRQVPAPARVALIFALAGCIAATLPSQIVAVSVQSPVGIAAALIVEVLVGVSFAAGMLVAYGATQVAGRILDYQVGFSAASIYDPSMQAPTSLFGGLLGMLALACFLAIDGPHALIRAIALSVESMPPGSFQLSQSMGFAVERAGMVFALGLAVAAPVMAALLLIDVAFAVAARSLPQLNVFMLNLPIKVMVALVTLAISLKWNVNLFEYLWSESFRQWGELAVAGSSP